MSTAMGNGQGQSSTAGFVGTMAQWDNQFTAASHDLGGMSIDSMVVYQAASTAFALITFEDRESHAGAV